MTEQEKKDAAQQIVTLLHSFPRGLSDNVAQTERLQILGYAVALETFELPTATMDSWLEATGLSRAGMHIEAALKAEEAKVPSNG